MITLFEVIAGHSITVRERKFAVIPSRTVLMLSPHRCPPCALEETAENIPTLRRISSASRERYGLTQNTIERNNPLAEALQSGQRKCLCCSKFFDLDHRNRERQRYCANAECRRASKSASQAAWLAQAQNGGYFCDPVHVARVRA